MAGTERGSGGLHGSRVPGQQRAHRAALLIGLLGALPALAGEIEFNPATTGQEFARFSRLAVQAMFPTPVGPARASGLASFDIGIAAAAVPVDEDAPYWRRAVSGEITTGGFLVAPRLVVSKGLGFVTVSGSYAKLTSSDIKVWGGTVDVPVVRGGVATPELAVRGSFATLSNVDDVQAKVYGAELFLSKGFGPITPYLAAGRMRGTAEATVHVTPTQDRSLSFEGDINRVTAGVRISLLAPKISVEVTKAEVTSYAAKVSFGF